MEVKVKWHAHPHPLLVVSPQPRTGGCTNYMLETEGATISMAKGQGVK